MSLATAWTLWSGLLFGQADLLPPAPRPDVPRLNSGAIVFGNVDLRPAPLPEPPPAPVPAIHLPADATPEQQSHVGRAIRELRAGGLPGLASQLDAALHTARQAEVRKALEGKQAQLQALQQEIAELQKQLPSEAQIHLRMMVLKVDRDKLRDADPALNQQLQLRLLSLVSPHIRIHPDAKPLEISELLDRLLAQKDSGAVTILSRPHVVMLDGREAHFCMAGERPTVVFQGRESPWVASHYSSAVKIRSKIVAPNCVHCFAVVEQADVKFDEAVIRAGGSQIPGVDRRQVATQFTAKFGETVLLPTTEFAETPHRPDAKTPVTLVFVTVERPAEATATSAIPQPPTNQTEPVIAPADVRPLLPPPSAVAKGPQWISPISLLMRTLLETDTDRFIPPATLDVDVKYYLAPPLPQPAVLPQSVPAPQQ